MMQQLSIMQFTRTRLATMGLFFVLGFISASWGIHVFTVKEKFNLNAAELSIAFFAIAIGSISALTYLGGWIAAAGNRTVCSVGGVLTCASAAGVLLVPSFITLIALLGMLGVGIATFDVGLNAQASTLEKIGGRPVTSSMHCLHSLGGIAGAGGGGILLSHNVSPAMHFIGTALVGLVLVFVLRPILTGKQLIVCDASLNSEIDPTNTPRIQYKHTGLWMLGGIAFITLVSESAINNWIAIYVREHLQAGAGLSSTTYAAYLAGVASGRLIGDFLRARIGSAALFAISGWAACMAFTAGLLFASPSLTLASFAIAGLGFANIYPIVLFTAGRIKGMQAAQGIARVARIGYGGVLIGPLLIGGIGQISSLTLGLAIIPLCAALMAFIGPRTIRRILVAH